MTKYFCLKDFEEEAKKRLKKEVFEYYASGNGQQETTKQNEKHYSHYKIKPRYLRNITKTDTSTTILGENICCPIGIAPTAYHKLAYKDGEMSTIRSAQKAGSIYILSTHSNHSIEELSIAAPNAIKWLQLYIFKERKVVEDFIKRAEKCNFKAIVVTVDAPFFSASLACLKNNFLYPASEQLGNLKGYFENKLIEDAETVMNESSSWEDIKWVKSLTKLPVVVKGVLTKEDALLAVDAGVDAIYVSNHGGRQLDEVLATIDALPEIVKAVGHKVEVYLDGGVRTGGDVFKALALGANMVFIGRPIVWGLGCQGEEGVYNVLELLKIDFDKVMTLAGCMKLKDITSEMIVHKAFQYKL